jgi:hypothetical protein
LRGWHHLVLRDLGSDVVKPIYSDPFSSQHGSRHGISEPRIRAGTEEKRVLRGNCKRSIQAHAGVLSKLGVDHVTIDLNTQNLFDKRPPFVNNALGVGYDPENADLLGRFISVGIRKDW